MGVKLCTSYSERQCARYSLSTLTGVYYFCKKKITLELIGSNYFKLGGDSMWTKISKIRRLWFFQSRALMPPRWVNQWQNENSRYKKAGPEGQESADRESLSLAIPFHSPQPQRWADTIHTPLLLSFFFGQPFSWVPAGESMLNLYFRTPVTMRSFQSFSSQRTVTSLWICTDCCSSECAHACALSW